MSIAVRVSVWILGGLVVVCAAVAVLALMQKQTLQTKNQSLSSQIANDQSQMSDLSAQVKKLQDDAQDLNTKISQAQQDKTQIQSQYADLQQKSKDIQSQLDQANSDRDDWKNRVGTISRERDALLERLKNQPVKIVYRTRTINVPSAQLPVPAMPVSSGQSIQVSSNPNETYWAAILRQKAALQLEVEKEKYDLDQAALQVADLKKQNSDLETDIKQVTNERDEIVEKIKYGQDLADNLSIDLARSRDDQEAVNQRADKLKEQNFTLLSQIRELNSQKVQLEENVSKLTDARDAMQRKLVETQSVIQSRIDDIWKIKESLDKRLAENAPGPSSSNGAMELPPIIVNAPNSQQPYQPTPAAQQQAPDSSAQNVPAQGGKTEGSVISINDPNNFVIVDLGQQNSAVNVGSSLKVYRNSNNIGSLQVIQVRRDICAADITNKSMQLKVGDIVRFE